MEFPMIPGAEQEMEERIGIPPRNHRLRRGIYLLPTSLSAANLLCGYYAILEALNGRPVDMDNAALAIGFAILFDVLDGRVARATRTNTEFGKQLDSLADMISFGVAPAFLAFAWGVRGVLAADVPEAKLVWELGWLVTFTFVICCAWRLARFNIQGMAPGGMRYFVGLATPPAAGMLAAVVHAVRTPITDWRVSLLWLALVLGIALLMPSTIRYYSFKDVQWARRQHSVAFVALALLLAAIFFYSEIALLIIAVAYVLSGPTAHLVRVVRHHTASRPA
jgi:CDP-diacylglycerol--serine O-phosphatidyltransferase